MYKQIIEDLANKYFGSIKNKKLSYTEYYNMLYNMLKEYYVQAQTKTMSAKNDEQKIKELTSLDEMYKKLKNDFLIDTPYATQDEITRKLYYQMIENNYKKILGEETYNDNKEFFENVANIYYENTIAINNDPYAVSEVLGKTRTWKNGSLRPVTDFYNYSEDKGFVGFITRIVEFTLLNSRFANVKLLQMFGYKSPRSVKMGAEIEVYSQINRDLKLNVNTTTTITPKSDFTNDTIKNLDPDYNQIVKGFMKFLADLPISYIITLDFTGAMNNVLPETIYLNLLFENYQVLTFVFESFYIRYLANNIAMYPTDRFFHYNADIYKKIKDNTYTSTDVEEIKIELIKIINSINSFLVSVSQS
jgi:hypothetical protein